MVRGMENDAASSKGVEGSPFKWRRSAVALCGVLSCWLSVACVAEPLTEETQPSEQAAIVGDVLAEVEIQPGYVVRLLELSPGNIAIHGSMNVDDVAGAPPFVAADESLGTVVDIYKHMHAKAGRVIADADVPESIRAASLRADERDQLLLELEATEKVSTLPEVDDHTPIQTLSSECSPDYYGDNYGAQWFKDTMCNKLNTNFPTTNVASWSGGYKWIGRYWIGFAWLAADFWDGARVDLSFCHDEPNTPGLWPFDDRFWICRVVLNNVFVGPRQGDFIYLRAYGGSAAIRGEGPCPRVHGCKMKTAN
jgi:hypothetical protein